MYAFGIKKKIIPNNNLSARVNLNIARVLVKYLLGVLGCVVAHWGVLGGVDSTNSLGACWEGLILLTALGRVGRG